MSDHQDDFDREISMLREGRPTLTALELDRAKSRVRRSTETRSHRWQRFVRTRGVVVAMLAAGALMSGGGTALAVSGLSSSGAASAAQYGTGTGTSPENTAVPPANAVGPDEAAQQPTESTEGELPFTGFMAIPVLLIGLTLVGAGLVGRRVVRRPS